MNPERDDDLRALFDATADEASGAQLTRLRARAQDIPASARKSFWSRFAVPVFALATGAAAIGLVWRSQSGVPAESARSVAALAPSTAPTPVPTETRPVEQSVASNDDTPVADDAFDDLDPMALGDSDELWAGIGVDSDVDDDDELLAALDSWLEEDG
ncbi:MAG: hypothetical protein R3B13_00885 [Polyangiaceae bacterium]